MTGWTPEQLDARQHALEVAAFVVVLLATGALTGFGIYALAIGRLGGWVLLGLAAGMAVVAVILGGWLEEGDR